MGRRIFERISDLGGRISEKFNVGSDSFWEALEWVSWWSQGSYGCRRLKKNCKVVWGASGGASNEVSGTLLGILRSWNPETSLKSCHTYIISYKIYSFLCG